VSWLHGELNGGRNVLVHCQAGYSRSPALVAAYIMFVKEIGLEAAIEIIHLARPFANPNDSFITQLTIFQETSYNLSRWNKPTRMFYLERAAREIMNGEGSDLPLHMLAKFPRSPGDSGPVTPGLPRRRIRCRLCRYELATREHLMHGANAQNSPTASRRPSFGEYFPISAQSRRSSSTVSSRPFISPIGSSTLEGQTTYRQSNVSRLTPPNTEDMPVEPSMRTTSQSTSALESDEDETIGIELHGVKASLRQAGNAPRRSSNLKMTPIKNKEHVSDLGYTKKSYLLTNSACSGYFLEPMKWMEPYLVVGTISGKIICPNKKCGAKLGNFDWAGMRCNCHEWVTPGFCVARSKVEEVT